MQLPRKMSAQNVMASISRTLGNREQKSNAANEVRFAGDERKDKLYEPKHKQKLVRVLTVVAYVIFVSMAAILLSLYYTFLWDPKDLSVKMRIRPECANIKQRSPPIFPPPANMLARYENVTQAEKSIVRPAWSERTGQFQRQDDNSTTVDGRNDLLTMLTRITTGTGTEAATETETETETETKAVPTPSTGPPFPAMLDRVHTDLTSVPKTTERGAEGGS